jgi:hypothetical protein
MVLVKDEEFHISLYMGLIHELLYQRTATGYTVHVEIRSDVFRVVVVKDAFGSMLWDDKGKPLGGMLIGAYQELRRLLEEGEV